MRVEPSVGKGNGTYKEMLGCRRFLERLSDVCIYFGPFSQNGYASKTRTLVDDAKFETLVNRETKREFLQQVRRSSTGESQTGQKLIASSHGLARWDWHLRTCGYSSLEHLLFPVVGVKSISVMINDIISIPTV